MVFNLSKNQKINVKGLDNQIKQFGVKPDSTITSFINEHVSKEFRDIPASKILLVYNGEILGGNKVIGNYLPNECELELKIKDSNQVKDKEIKVEAYCWESKAVLRTSTLTKIEEFKRLCAGVNYMKPEDVVLLHGGKVLIQDQNTVSGSGISDGDVVILVPNGAGGSQIKLAESIK